MSTLLIASTTVDLVYVSAGFCRFVSAVQNDVLQTSSA